MKINTCPILINYNFIEIKDIKYKIINLKFQYN